METFMECLESWVERFGASSFGAMFLEFKCDPNPKRQPQTPSRGWKRACPKK